MRDFDHQNIRERIDGLAPHEALCVVLGAYDTLRAEIRASVADVAQATGLQPTPALVLLTLWDARGRIVTADAMGGRFREVMGCHILPESYRTAIKRVRRAVPDMRIINAARIGYRLEREHDAAAPWEMDQ